MKIIIKIFTLLFCLAGHLIAQEVASSSRWQLAEEGGIHWQLEKNEILPHADHIAMSGQSIDMILEWEISAEGVFHATRVIRWPMLRTIPDNTHASLQKKLAHQNDPIPVVNA